VVLVSKWRSKMVMQVDGNTDPNSFGESLHLKRKGVRKVERVYKPLDEVLMSRDKNRCRTGGVHPPHVEALKHSFLAGVRHTEFLPIIEKLPIGTGLPIGSNKNYQLVDGYNRLAALRELGYTHYWFDVAEFGFDKVDPVLARSMLALMSNAHLPTLESSDDDIFRAICDLVFEKKIPAKSEDIKLAIKDVCVGKNSRSRQSRIARQVLESTGVQDNFLVWDSTRIQDELTIKYSLVSHGNLDSARDEHGWTCLESYESDTIMGAIGKFAEDGKESYIVGHVKQPSTKANLDSKRAKMKSTMERRQESLIAMCEFYKEHGRLPFQLVGFLPQSMLEKEIISA